MKVTPLDAWIKEKTNGQKTSDWQLKKLNDTLSLAQNSPFYRKNLHLKELKSLDEIEKLPFLTQQDIIEQDKQLLCVHQGNIKRIVSLHTSGSTDAPKRIYFTEADQELTLDFFARGMVTLVNPGERMVVLMPCDREGRVGDLICRAIRRIPVEPIGYGLIRNLDDALDMLVKSEAQTLVGIPVQVLALARYSKMLGAKTAIERLLLSADNVPLVLIKELMKLWGCEVYQHYGMTEMGLGGAIDCDAHMGYHMREADLYFEIIDPVTGRQLPNGQYGEVVFTTLTRQGMPLIRYRTGDISCILVGQCACGTSQRRLMPIKRRLHDYVCLAPGHCLIMPDLDEALFSLEQIMDFSVKIGSDSRKKHLKIEVAAFEQLPRLTQSQVLAALNSISSIKNAQPLEIEIKISLESDFSPLHQAKRLINYTNDKGNVI
ncbi:MAG: DVU_1553 family AMP-dependent CoA ligase [Bacillota bacterium]